MLLGPVGVLLAGGRAQKHGRRFKHWAGHLFVESLEHTLATVLLSKTGITDCGQFAFATIDFRSISTLVM